MILKAAWVTQLLLSALWVENRDFAEGAALPEPDTYSVWVWAKADATGAEHSVSVGGNRFAYSLPQSDGTSFVWVRAGRRDFMEGQYAIESDDDVAMVVITGDDSYSPQQALPYRRVFDSPRAVNDRRAAAPRHTDTVFTMSKFDSLEAWESTADELRQRILLGSGLWPAPAKTPLNAEVFDRYEGDGFAVEKVRFEASSNFYVTGNLYRPVTPGPHPAILMPHGHWDKGRLEDGDRCSVPARAITFAKLGAISFTYDMIGYVDSVQLSHRWSRRSEKIWGIHPFSIQLWSSIRAIDFLESLEDVDPNRIGCTGASGGGTQTFAVTAVDPRIKVAAPVNMISSTMQGGCVCENAPVLRLSNSNMEVGALTAPRPMLMVSASGDWTKLTRDVEYPAVRSIYELYGSAERLSHAHVDAPHNYNVTSRNAVYRFMGKWLLGRDDLADFAEPEYSVPSSEKLRLYDDDAMNRRPGQGEVIDELKQWKLQQRKHLLEQLSAGSTQLRARWTQALSSLTDARLPLSVNAQSNGFFQRNVYVLERFILGRTGEGDQIPAMLFTPAGSDERDVVLVVHDSGKSSLMNLETDGPGDLVSGLLEKGRSVLLIDPFLLGEHHSPFGIRKRTVVGNFMDTFEPTDTAMRVQDILTAHAWLKSRRNLSGKVTLVGLGDASAWTTLAAGIDPSFERLIVDEDLESFNSDAPWTNRLYIPSIRVIGDVEAASVVYGTKKIKTIDSHDSTALLKAL